MREEQVAYEPFKLQWLLEHGYTLTDLIYELEMLRCESGPEISLESVFSGLRIWIWISIGNLAVF